MKKLSLLLVAFALVTGLSQCKKPKLPVFNGETQHVVLNASWDNGGSKIADDNAGHLKWEEGDKLDVKQDEVSIGTLICKDVTNGIFAGCIKKTTGMIKFTFGNQNFMDQTGDLNGVVYLESPELEYNSDGDYGDVPMKMPYAVMKLDLNEFAATTKTGGTTVTISIDGLDKASVANITSDSKEVYVAIPTDETPSDKLFTFNGNGMIASVTWKLKENTFYTLENGEGAAIVIKPAAPVFSVSAGNKVVFAPGNLYYDGGNFYFEANQWDFRTYGGENSRINGEYKTNGTPSGDWGLFGWSTGATNNNWGMNTSTNSGDYSGTFKDWGQNVIDGDAANTWHTLSNVEWRYLIGLNTTKRTDASNLRKVLNLSIGGDSSNKAYGMVILPDGTKNSAKVFENIKSTGNLAAYGAVFLPATGYRNGTEINYPILFGNFWTNTNGTSGNAYTFDFNDGGVGSEYGVNIATNDNHRYYGFAVRLVRNAQ